MTPKFRVWDRGLKGMFAVDSLDLGVGNLSFWVNDMLFERSIEELPLISLMQWTGLRDKNGAEIFEGDIVNHVIGDRVIETIVVKIGEFTIWDSYDYEWRFNGVNLVVWQGSDHIYEVIGNVYQDPDLLEVT